MGAQSSVPGHVRKPDAQLCGSSITFLQSPQFDSLGAVTGLLYQPHLLSFPPYTPNGSHTELLTNVQCPNTHCHFLEVHSAVSLLSCHTQWTPNVGFYGVFYCLSPPWLSSGSLLTEITFSYYKLHLDGWTGVSSSTFLSISKLACLCVWIRYRWIVANDGGDFFSFLASDVLSWTTYVEDIFFS